MSVTPAAGTDVVFSEAFNDSEFKLLELNPELLALVESGAPLCFKGNQTDTIVLCSDDKTYDVKIIATSNTVYVGTSADEGTGGKALQFAEGSPEFVVQGSVGSFLETVEGAPRTERIDELLKQTPFAGPMAETEAAGSGGAVFSLDTLLDNVQASKAETLAALDKLGAFELAGAWRVLEPKYAAATFSLILTSAVAEDWKLDSLPFAAVVASLKEHDAPEFVVRVLLRLYGAAVDGADEETYRLSLDKISLFEAIQILESHPRWPLPDFMETWQEKLPEGITADMDHLAGNALVYATGAGSGDDNRQIMYYPASTLPLDVKKRLAALFSQQAVWVLDDIAPYMEAAAVATSTTVEKILFKHARSFKDKNGVKHYNKR